MKGLLFRFLYILVINAGIFALLLVVIEGVGQVNYRVRHGVWLPVEQKGQAVFQYHPYLAARPRAHVTFTSDGKTITTLANATRWTGAADPPGEAVRVAVFGGSSTFGTGVDDRDSWPALLQKELGPGYAVTNHGVPGYSTAEAIIQLALLAREGAPRLVVFYEGWNDLRNYHVPAFGADYYWHGRSQLSNLDVHLFEGKPPLLQAAAEYLVTFRFVQKWGAKLFPAPQAAQEVYRTPDPEVDRIYLRNLTTLRVLAGHAGAAALFVPQVLNAEAYAGKKGSRWWTPFIEDDALPGLMARFNRIMIDGACAAGQADCRVAADVPDLPWAPLHFVDDGHLSAEGGRLLAQRVAAHLLSLSTR
ncbi:MAG: GDSL-type esterase/lipase family protein [Magnetococcus sp. DMHC-8]